MKKIVLILIMFLTTLPVGAEVLKGGVVYTVETAREEAFKGMEYEISMEPYKEYMTDPGFIAAGKDGGKPRVSKRGRKVTYFTHGEYGVRYLDNKNIAFYYTTQGTLDAIEFFSDTTNYPSITKKYDVNGNLGLVIFRVQYNDSYIYDLEKRLVGHWVGRNCYDEKGDIIETRK